MGGLGRIPWAPGTWGSLVGAILGLLATHWLSSPLSPILLAVTFLLCVFICTEAERALDIHDAPLIVLDETWAMAGVVIVLRSMEGRVFSTYLFSSVLFWRGLTWPWFVVALVLFRLFDIVKPSPLKVLATLPDGWGIMADDVGAAVYTVGMLWLLVLVMGLMQWVAMSIGWSVLHS